MSGGTVEGNKIALKKGGRRVLPVPTGRDADELAGLAGTGHRHDDLVRLGDDEVTTT